MEVVEVKYLLKTTKGPIIEIKLGFILASFILFL